jgi:branched-chain amino acid transport system permease protein
MNIWYDANSLLIQATFVSFLLALSLQVSFRWGVFSFAGLGAYTIGAYAAGILFLRASFSTWPAIFAAAALAAIVCYLFAFLMSRLGGLYLGMATIAFDLILAVLAQNGAPLTGTGGMMFGVLGEVSTWQILLICSIAAAGLAWTERGRLGRQVEAVSANPELALAMGIRVVTLRRTSFALSGFLGGLAGGISIMISTTISPAAVGFHLIITALTMIIVGGSRSWLGALIGAVILTWLPELLHVADEWKLVIFGVIVTVLSVWLPEGLLGLWIRIGRWVRVRIVSSAPAAPVSADQSLKKEAAG